jgi:hypothetical protein
MRCAKKDSRHHYLHRQPWLCNRVERDEIPTEKLHGAALNSFMKKCERDTAAASCEAAAVEKKLAGAAKTSFAKKCVKDSTAKPRAQ